MKHQPNFRGKAAAGTNVNQVKQQNAASAAGQNAFGTEFGAETDVQQVKQQNAQAEARKNQAPQNK